MTMTNSDFLAEVYGDLGPRLYGWITTFRSDPNNSPTAAWAGRMYKGTPAQAALIDRALEDNTYFCTAVLHLTDEGEFVRRKESFERLAVLVVDDVQLSDVNGYSYAIQTSPGKHQIGILLDADDPDCADRALIDRVMQALATRGRTNDRSGNACVRYVRLPGGSNTKPRAAGVWATRLETWAPNVRWTLDDACAAVDIDLDQLKQAAKHSSAVQQNHASHGEGFHAGEMVTALTAPLNERAYHESITRLAASLIAGGMFPGAAVEFLYSLMDQVKPSGPLEEVQRWASRRAEIPRAVKSAEKFAPEERKPAAVNVTLNMPEKEAIEPQGDVEPLDWDRLSGTQPDPVTWALEGWLPHRHVTLLAANGGVGKSNLSLQLAVSIGTGTEFMGIPTTQGKVLIISAEDDAQLVHLRMNHICKDAGIAMPDLKRSIMVYDMTQHDCILWRDGLPTARMQWLADLCVAHRPEVVILDNASDLYADNENDRTAVRGFLRCLKTISGATGAAMLLLAHVDKASVRVGAGNDTDSTFSGSTAWNNSARSRWAMVVGEDRSEVLIKHEKCNVGKKQEPFSVEYDGEAHVFRKFGTVPGASVAAALVRNGQRAAILKLLSIAEKADQTLSMNANANNNAFRVLQASEGFPKIDRNQFFSLLFQMEREGLVEQIEYTRDRKKYKRVALTPAGQTRAAIGSGAGPTWAQ